MTLFPNSSKLNSDTGDTISETDYMPTFYIGHHQSIVSQRVTDTVLRQAQNAGYDMLTSFITTQHFQTRVLSLVTNHLLKISNEIHETKSRGDTPFPIIPPLLPADTLISPGDTVTHLIVYTSPWIDLGSPDPLVSNISRQVLNIEIAYAAFCGIGNVVISGPRSTSYRLTENDQLTQYARAIQEALAIGNFIQILIHLPMYTKEECTIPKCDLALYTRNQYRLGKPHEKKENDLFESWDSWNLIRNICRYNSRLSVALEISQQLPTDSLQSRWYAEPVRILCFTLSTFTINKGGHPSLTKAHQILITRYMRLKIPPWLLLCDVGPIPEVDGPDCKIDLTFDQSSTSKTGTNRFHSGTSLSVEATEFPTVEISDQKGEGQKMSSYLIYLRYLQRNQPARTMIETFGSGYQDYLQAPLQPLADNLESITYEVFEKDTVKYDWYERAVTLALSDWSVKRKPTSCANGIVVVAVVGSGRGPLVTRVLRASKKTGVLVEVWAIEKNPNAYVLLLRTNQEEWGGVVNVVKSDMRAWKGPTRKILGRSENSTPTETSNLPNKTYGHVDILVSELLGSFADNELSPECLDGVQHVLAPKYGISIPSSYTSHITPISAPRLHTEVTQRTLTDEKAPNTPYVVMLHSFDYLASPAPDYPRIQKAWEFMHPLPTSTIDISSSRRAGGVSGGGGGSMCGGDGANEHNVRAARLKFICKDRGVMHGIAGYFEAILYDGINGKVELSTRPDNIDLKSENMISWFPIYFPLKNPVYFPDDSELEVSLWRQTDDRKVWYEWLVEAFVMIGLDSRLRIGMSSMGSSREVACLM